MEKIQTSAPWIGAAGPHSVMPFGSLLNIPAINMFVFRRFSSLFLSLSLSLSLSLARSRVRALSLFVRALAYTIAY